MTDRLLIIDDDPMVRASLSALIRAEGYDAVEASSAEEGRGQLERGPRIDLVISDIRLPGMSGLEFLKSLKSRVDAPPIIVITARASRQDALQALECGASDFLAKPVNDHELLFRIRRNLASLHLLRENQILKEQLQGDRGLAGLIGHHPTMQRVFQTVRSVAETRATLLVYGESGTGKTMLARALHLLSTRRAGPFVEVACGAIPEELIESELFGHVRGAYTGAVTDRRGKVEAAHGGTLFLDEVGVASHALQVKLLRVLQERSFERVGGTETIHADLRLVLATNRNLEEEVKAGRFREDLYYRINVVSVSLPPLRERPTDIPALAQAFLARFSEEHARPNRQFDPSVLAQLSRYSWPGNVRQLENAVERAVVLSSQEVIFPHDFPAPITGDPRPETGDRSFLPLKDAMEPKERDYLEDVLRWTRGNRSQAADILGINRSTLFHKMRRHSLQNQDFGEES